ncbi:MAG: ABC transporter permease [Kiritimatiellia bacterium]
MRKFMALLRRELGAVFLAPMGYVTVAVYMSATGWTFLQAAQAQTGSSMQLEALHAISVLVWMPVLITVVCMRLFAEEKRVGTIETLLTTSVSDWTVVLAKYCGALLFVLVGLAASMLPLPLLASYASGIAAVDTVAVFGGGIMLVLVAMCCTSIGVLVSLLTRNQIVAAICCFWAICVPLMIKPLMGALPFVRQEMLDRLSVEQHVLLYAGGLLSFSPVVLYVSVTGLMLFIAVRILESRRWI